MTLPAERVAKLDTVQQVPPPAARVRARAAS
jgi:hypothetical protein